MKKSKQSLSIRSIIISGLIVGVVNTANAFSVSANPVLVDVIRNSEGEAKRRESNEPTGLMKQFHIRSSGSSEWSLGDVCIFEVLQATDATTGSPIDASTPLPLPWQRKGNDNTWIKEYSALTGVSPIFTGPSVRGLMAATWNVGMGTLCPTETGSLGGKAFARWLTNIDGNAYVNLKLDDMHGPLGYVPFDDDTRFPPTRGVNYNKQLTLEGPFDIIQHLLWYRISAPSNIHYLGGPFRIHRWFTWRWTDEGNDKCMLRGGVIYEENVEVFLPDGSSLGKVTITPPYGCAFKPTGNDTTYQVPSSVADPSKKEPYVDMGVFVED